MDIKSTMNALSLASITVAADKKTLSGQLVTQTLNNLNSNSNGLIGGKNSDYDFQTKVLSAGYLSKGFTLDTST